MKRALSVVFVILLCLLLYTGTAESAVHGPFVPKITNGVERSASEWFASPESRALLTVSLSLDYNAELEPVLKDGLNFSRDTYVGRSGSLLYVCYSLLNDERPLLLAYSPLIKTFYYAMLEVSPSAVLETVLEELCEDSLFKNDPAALLDVMNSLSEELQN